MELAELSSGFITERFASCEENFEWIRVKIELDFVSMDSINLGAKSAIL